MQNEERADILSTTADSVVEGVLVDEGMAEAVRRKHARGMAKKAIGRELGLDIKTVWKWLDTEWRPQRRERDEPALAKHDEWIRKRLPEVGYSAKVLHRELGELGYDGSYVTVQRYVRPLRTAAQPEVATARYETAPGAQAQVDWGMLNVWIGASKVKVHLFVMVLGFSRRIFAHAYLNEKLGNLLDGHEAAFAHFGGRTETILYDNPRTIVLAKDESTGEVEWNRRFKDRMDIYGVEIKLCRYYRAQTKGKVESGVKYVKRNALAGRRFESPDELNAWLTTRSLTAADERVHATTHEIPRERFERDERIKMIAVDRRPTSRECRTVRRQVATDGYVTIETDRYPVPYEWCRAEVDVQLSETEVRIVHGEQAIEYERSRGQHRVVAWAGAPRPLQRGAGRESVPGDPAIRPDMAGFDRRGERASA
ncbi:MAG: IS21 family transposase [Thermoanaerobaculia bacterium]